MRTTRSLTASRSIPGVCMAGGCVAGGMHGRGACVACIHAPAREQKDWQTGVKTLPSSNFVAGSKNISEQC